VPSGITVQVSPFVGKYLADATGRALYTWGGDLPGDCHDDPQSLCIDSCANVWPAFHDPATVLAADLDPAVIGSVMRSTAPVTTYYGWPLYYYTTDVLNATTGKWSTDGQGKGRVWHLAKLRPSNVVIMKSGATLYLGNGAGMTLYAFDQDQVGDNPVSACTGTCLDAFVPFSVNTVSPVTSLEPGDFRLFVRPDSGEQQLAYKGAPLYRALSDQRSGDRSGTTTTGWTVVAP
jgi:predicted lipoprotein with Yx(FWY)xxD motif